jgi:pyridoxamine 5'-phosphate oxidase
MSAPLPPFYDDLDATLAEALRLIAAGVADRRSAFHHPTLGTVGRGANQPRLRTMILRAFDPGARSLRFHTDLRSEKTAEIQMDGQVGVHFYDPEAKIQIRMDGWAQLHTHDSIADAAWAETRPFSRQVYGVEPEGGAQIAAGGAFTLPEATEAATDVGRKNFCAVVVDIVSLEWLFLASEGHRRALFDFVGDERKGQWLAP